MQCIRQRNSLQINIRWTMILMILMRLFFVILMQDQSIYQNSFSHIFLYLIIFCVMWSFHHDKINQILAFKSRCSSWYFKIYVDWLVQWIYLNQTRTKKKIDIGRRVVSVSFYFFQTTFKDFWRDIISIFPWKRLS